MLVLERRIGEAVIIHVPGYDEPIRVVLLGRRGDCTCKMGFEAPREVNFVREEIDHE